MTAPSVRTASSADHEAWNAFVRGRPESTYSHLWEWRQVLAGAYGKRTRSLVAEEGGELTGVLALVPMKGPIAGNRLVSMPFLDRGGPLAATTASGRALVEAALEIARREGASGLDLRGLQFPGASEPGEGSRRHRLLLSLEPDEEGLWKAIGGKVRNQVRKSERAGLGSRRAGAAELGRFYRVFSENMRDLGSPVHSRGLFEEILSAFGPAAGLYLTTDDDGDTVAAGLWLRHGDLVTVPWASSLRSARSSCPNHSLYWRAIRDAAVAGATTFDFGRSTIGTGTYHFKKQWGARGEPLDWVFLDSDGRPQPDSYWNASRNRGLAEMWRRLPLRCANWLGPRIRRHIPN